MASKMNTLGVDNVKNIVSNSINIKEALIKIGYRAKSGNLYRQFKRFCDSNNISYLHFKDVSNNKIKRTPENIFCKNSSACQKDLKKYFYRRDDVEIHHCYICGCSDIWNGKPLVFVLDHINGNNKDNRISNLRLVCHNCNSQLPTFAGKNLKLLKTT